MIILEIKQQQKNKNRCNLYAEDGFIGALSFETIAKYSIHENTEISEEDFRTVVGEDNEKYAFDKALHFLAYSARTKSDVARYLKAKQINEEAVEEALKKLIGYGYINDFEYAVQFIKERIAKEGKHAIEYRLRQKGVDNETVKEALLSFSDEDEKNGAYETYAWLCRKYKDEDKNKRNMRIMRSMAAKGYDYDLIQSIVRGEED